jgi:hypothetical protein
MILLKRFSFWLALCGLGAAIVLLKGQNAKVPDPGPVSEPPRSFDADGSKLLATITPRPHGRGVFALAYW